MTTINDPLTDCDCDLRDFPYMPLDVVRLRDSDISALSNGEEFRCAVLLWCASWHQVPAASLPDDDIVLSQLAGFGRVVNEWKKVRNGALRGWIKCSDGRLYHPVVAEKANEAWESKKKYRLHKENDRVRKAELRALKKEKEKQNTSSGIKNPPDNNELSERQLRVVRGTNQNFSGTNPDIDKTTSSCPCENDLIGKGKGIGKEKEIISPDIRLPDSSNSPAETMTERSEIKSSRATDISVLLRKLAVRPMTSVHPLAIEWANDVRIKDEILIAAVETAREYKQSGNISPYYLAPIIKDLIAPQKTRDPPDNWWSSNEGIDRKGREIGLQARPAENYTDYKNRIFEEINKRNAK